MKWYWILLIALGAVALGVIISMAIKKPKNEAGLPIRKETVPVDTKTAAEVGKPIAVTPSSKEVDVTTNVNSDGTKTIALRQKAGI